MLKGKGRARYGYEKVIDLIREVKACGVGEFELQQGRFPGCCENGQKAGDSSPAVPAAEKEAAQKEEAPVSIQDGTIIRSPLVGIYHGADILAGDQVEEGQVLGAIDAMKLMNDIVAVCSGVVTEVLVKDQELVEYGQPLFVIEG